MKYIYLIIIVDFNEPHVEAYSTKKEASRRMAELRRERKELIECDSDWGGFKARCMRLPFTEKKKILCQYITESSIYGTDIEMLF